MKLYLLNVQSYEHLLNATRTAKRQTNAHRWLKTVGRAIAQTFSHSHDPKICKICTVETRAGQTIWQVYDPITNHRIRFDTEAEVRIWLDQRFRT